MVNLFCLQKFHQNWPIKGNFLRFLAFFYFYPLIPFTVHFKGTLVNLIQQGIFPNISKGHRGFANLSRPLFADVLLTPREGAHLKAEPTATIYFKQGPLALVPAVLLICSRFPKTFPFRAGNQGVPDRDRDFSRAQRGAPGAGAVWFTPRN